MTSGSVTTEMNFCPPGEEVIFYPTDRKKSKWPFKPHAVTIHDLRPLQDELSFDRNGFVLVNQTSACKDFYDSDEVERIYIPEVIELVAELTGADKVITFGMMTRTNNPAAEEGNLPAFGAHVDYGDRTVRMFATDVLGKEEAGKWLAGRYMLINVWRPIKVVESVPFAVCDASTVAESDLCYSEVRGGLGDPNQRWYYVPEMRPDEVLAFKLYDSDSSAVQWTAHSAFEHPDTAPDAAPRESIEMRTIAFFEKGVRPPFCPRIAAACSTTTSRPSYSSGR